MLSGSFICFVCKKETRCCPSNVKTKKYCSKHCMNIGRKTERVTYQCVQCNKTVEVTPGQLRSKWRKNKFCSKKCLGEFNKKFRDGDTTKSCSYCKRVLPLSEFRKRKYGYFYWCNACFLKKKEESIGSNPIQKYMFLVRYAEKNNLVMNIQFDDYKLIIQNGCHYCGGKLPRYGYGLDRKDPDEGYIKTNVVPCCSRCNTVKNNVISYDEMSKLGRIFHYNDELRKIKDDCASIVRPYSKDQVESLRSSFGLNYLPANYHSLKLRNLFKKESHIVAFGVVEGSQAIQCAKAGLKAIYLSGWQMAATGNTSESMYPDLSLYPYNSLPSLIRRINNSLSRSDQIDKLEDKFDIDYELPIVADAEAGFGGVLNVFELSRQLIEAGAAALHLEDQLSSAKRCGHLGGKVLIPIRKHINNLVAARLASDMLGVPLVIIARTDAYSAKYLVMDNYGEEERKHITNDRPTSDGFYEIKGSLEMAIERGIAYAPYADMIWCETSSPDLAEAKEFADAIRNKFPEKMLAYNLSPSFNWVEWALSNKGKGFTEKLASYGYKFQFITLAGYHSLCNSSFNFAKDFNENGIEALIRLQESELKAEKLGYTATKHQREVGVGYFDKVMETIGSSNVALVESTEKTQF